jgi:hypothetical protein
MARMDEMDDRLFKQMERLGNATAAELDGEIKRTKKLTAEAKAVTRAASHKLLAAKVLAKAVKRRG